jgi:hypothetical protein
MEASKVKPLRLQDITERHVESKLKVACTKAKADDTKLVRLLIYSYFARPENLQILMEKKRMTPEMKKELQSITGQAEPLEFVRNLTKVSLSPPPQTV